ncbi:hypothetical protein IGI04_042678 [Brassica rapa subsp. trilocularis]|uniref:Retrotransposon Copia-like N-terminal domain-containing protein n=2 Tax=Brassica rapa subsp. trilocularis TaxID=1813537 RepID=A0ABQ7KM06_BRACM|nr:hypothetical protein IGI04_042678 [Brassica rapa subsp. trilocularis]
MVTRECYLGDLRRRDQTVEWIREERARLEQATQGWCVRDPRFKFSSQGKMEQGMNMRMKVAVTFKGSNYLVWSRMVKTAVGSKGLWGHITTGEAPKLITQGGDQEEVSNEAALQVFSGCVFGLVGVITSLSPRFSKLFTSSCFKMDSGMKMKVAVVFKGNNYLVWSRMVKTAVGSKGLWGHITSGTAPKPSLVAYMGAPSSRNNDQDFIRKADIDALIKMFKDNGNINGYSYGASMIARTVGDLDCITRTDTTPTSDHGGERSEPETTQESSGASGTHDQDVEVSEQQDGAEAMDGLGGNDGNGKSLVAYTGASSSRSNDDYIKRSDLDALFKMLKENGNTYGYSFGASMIAYKDDHLIRELVERLEARNGTSQDPRNHATTPPEVGSPSHLDHEGGEEHEEPMQEANQDEGGVENEGEESIGSDGHGHDHGVTQTPSQDEVQSNSYQNESRKNL